MSTSDTEPASDLVSRYGDPRRGRQLALVLGGVVAATFLGWLAWAIWFHATPEVTSTLTTYDVVDAHTATAVLEVSVEGDAEEATCRVQALAADHSVVGVLDFEPVDGRNEVTITTERKATTVERVGCTAKGQSRPR